MLLHWQPTESLSKDQVVTHFYVNEPSILDRTYPMTKLEIQTTCGFKESTKICKNHLQVVKKDRHYMRVSFKTFLLIVTTCCDIVHVEHTIRSYSVVPFDGCNAYVFASVIRGFVQRPISFILWDNHYLLAGCCQAGISGNSLVLPKHCKKWILKNNKGPLVK